MEISVRACVFHERFIFQVEPRSPEAAAGRRRHGRRDGRPGADVRDGGAPGGLPVRLRPRGLQPQLQHLPAGLNLKISEIWTVVFNARLARTQSDGTKGAEWRDGSCRDFTLACRGNSKSTSTHAGGARCARSPIMPKAHQ